MKYRSQNIFEDSSTYYYKPQDFPHNLQDPIDSNSEMPRFSITDNDQEIYNQSSSLQKNHCSRIQSNNKLQITQRIGLQPSQQSRIFRKPLRILEKIFSSFPGTNGNFKKKVKQSSKQNNISGCLMLIILAWRADIKKFIRKQFNQVCKRDKKKLIKFQNKIKTILTALSCPSVEKIIQVFWKDHKDKQKAGKNQDDKNKKSYYWDCMEKVNKFRQSIKFMNFEKK